LVDEAKLQPPGITAYPFSSADYYDAYMRFPENVHRNDELDKMNGGYGVTKVKPYKAKRIHKMLNSRQRIEKKNVSSRLRTQNRKKGNRSHQTKKNRRHTAKRK
jgi:hypothetical protein